MEDSFKFLNELTNAKITANIQFKDLYKKLDNDAAALFLKYGNYGII